MSTRGFTVVSGSTPDLGYLSTLKFHQALELPEVLLKHEWVGRGASVSEVSSLGEVR